MTNKKNELTKKINKDIINLRLECVRLAYTSVYPISDVIAKASEIENYILGRNTPQTG